ncbi:hypothetical protein GWI33_022187 [Rhynchophorus ferrugineus]|uniref:Uncharacterized protein n=1 Tax=Rhynchophorus ferrugineus TaxID=354439 RepID=A0A834MJ77_RHYFE|nr:hypothetical protein GWI33_022187 [Rhynchophorus ferrugineus]
MRRVQRGEQRRDADQEAEIVESSAAQLQAWTKKRTEPVWPTILRVSCLRPNLNKCARSWRTLHSPSGDRIRASAVVIKLFFLSSGSAKPVKHSRKMYGWRISNDNRLQLSLKLKHLQFLTLNPC